jgi:type VI secretion system secreted protein VgrG
MDAASQVRLEAALGGGDEARVIDFDLREAISVPYDMRVTVAVPADTDAAALLGQDLALTIVRGAADIEERVVGLVTEVQGEARGDDDSEGLPLRFTLRVQPAVALLALRRNTRIFQEKKVPEIVQAILDESLGPYSRSADVGGLEGTYEKREYCVQYEESDLDFIQRLMDEEGIHYTFDHSGEQEKIKLADRNGAFEDIGAIPFAATNQTLEDQERVREFRGARRVAITHVQLRDFNFKTAGAPVEDEAGAEDSDFPGERRDYDHGHDRNMRAGILKVRAGHRHEAHVIAGAARHGTSQAVSIRPGRVFELTGSATAGDDGRYLITEVAHDLRGVVGSGSDADEPYVGRFTCVPADLPFRPARVTRRPIIEGVETAKVVGPGGEEIHPDEHGRVKVQFPWDREGQNDENSSCWLRVEQPWAGDGWGWMWIPRIGMEVVVQFVDGNPDRPVITGCVYNGENLPPYPLPDEKTKSTFKSNSSIGGGGFNEFRFEDKKGSEQIYTHAQKDFDEVVLNNHTTDVGNDQTNTVDGNQKQEIDIDQTEKVGSNSKMTVKTHRKVHVKGNFDETVDGGETRAVIGGSKEVYESTEDRLVIGGVTEIVVGPPELHKVDGAKLEVIIGGQTQVIVGTASETVSATSTTVVTGPITVITPAAATWNGATGATIKGAAAVNFIAPPNLTFTGTTLNDNCSIYTQMGTTSLAFSVIKGEGIGTKLDTVLGLSLSMYAAAISAGGAKASAAGIKAGLSNTKIEIVGILFNQGAFENSSFDFNFTL